MKAIVARRDAMFESLDKESDRGVALISVAYVDEVLEELLRGHFSIRSQKPRRVVAPLFEGLGPLGSFSAKIKISYALDLIPAWLYEDLEVIRKIRNHAAHAYGAFRFDAKDVVTLTERLVGADRAVTEIAKTETPKRFSERRMRTKRRRPADKGLMERMRFVMTVSYIAGLLATTESWFKKPE